MSGDPEACRRDRSAAAAGTCYRRALRGRDTRWSDIDELLDRVPGWSGRPRTVTPLEGGITNRNYRVDLDGESFVARAPGKDTDLLGIDRDHELEAAQRAADLGIGPPVVAFVEPDGSLITRYVEGGPAEALDRPPQLAAGRGPPAPLPRVGADHPGVRLVPGAVDYAATARDHGVEVPDGLRRGDGGGRAGAGRVRRGARAESARATTTCCRPTSWRCPTVASACWTGSTPA